MNSCNCTELSYVATSHCIVTIFSMISLIFGMVIGSGLCSGNKFENLALLTMAAARAHGFGDRRVFTYGLLCGDHPVHRDNQAVSGDTIKREQ